jgi:hypothetical protein
MLLAIAGASFELRFHPTAGMTYQFLADLKPGSHATHLRWEIFPPDSIVSSAADGELYAQMGIMFGASESSEFGRCEIPSGFGNVAVDSTRMNLGNFIGPADGRESWGQIFCNQGDMDCCAHPETVGPPEAPCDGIYSHFPGQSFPRVARWEWTAPSTNEFLLKVSSNCNVPYYADPEQPGCVSNEDGVECQDPSLLTCQSATGVKIVAVNRAVHIKKIFDIPLPALELGRRLQRVGDAGSAERIASADRIGLLANLFHVNQPPAMTFPTNIVPLDCNNAENIGRPLCIEYRRRRENSGGGHRRTQEQGCPHSTFLRREETMLVDCGLSRTNAGEDIVFPASC